MTEPVYIARCPVHGLHGERSECFVCGGPVEQVPMIPVESALTEEMVERAKLALIKHYRPGTDGHIRDIDGNVMTTEENHAEAQAREVLLAAGPWTDGGSDPRNHAPWCSSRHDGPCPAENEIGPWTGKLDREKAIEVAWWRAERDRHQLRAERAEAELADLRAGRTRWEARLCDDDGIVRGGPMHHGTDYPCTGHAHYAGEHIRCTGSAHEPEDPTEGLPDDLAAILRDPSIIVAQDAAVFDLIAKWRDAPSNTILTVCWGIPRG